MDNLILNIKVFVFIFCILCIIRDTYGILKILKLKEGKYSLSTERLFLLGGSISYVLTMLIMGF
jgi:hypothetical protein